MGVSVPGFARESNWVTDKNMKHLQLDEELVRKAREQMQTAQAKEYYAQNQLAIKFIRDQANYRRDTAAFVISALFMADKEFVAVLDQKDAKIPWFDILLGISLITLPHLGFIGKFVKKLADSKNSRKEVLSEMIKSVNDIYGAAVEPIMNKNDALSESMGKAMASIDFIGATMGKIFQEIGFINYYGSMLETLAIKQGMTLNDVKRKWEALGIDIEDNESRGVDWRKQADNQLSLLSRVFLYDLLKAYTSNNVTFYIHSKHLAKSEKAGLPEDGNKVGSFTGMTQATRDAIYARFGTATWLASGAPNGNPARPLIFGYRDMVLHWGLKVQTDNSVEQKGFKQ